MEWSKSCKVKSEGFLLSAMKWLCVAVLFNLSAYRSCYSTSPTCLHLALQMLVRKGCEMEPWNDTFLS